MNRDIAHNLPLEAAYSSLFAWEKGSWDMEDEVRGLPHGLPPPPPPPDPTVPPWAETTLTARK